MGTANPSFTKIKTVKVYVNQKQRVLHVFFTANAYLPVLYTIIMFSYFSRRRTTYNLWGRFFFIHNNIYVFFFLSSALSFPLTYRASVYAILLIYIFVFTSFHSRLWYGYIFFTLSLLQPPSHRTSPKPARHGFRFQLWTWHSNIR